MNKYYSLSIVASILLIQATAMPPIQAKAPVTITERQEMLLDKVNKAEKSGELTADEANSLRNSHAKIMDKETRMKSKNGGKLSYKNINQIEKDLNKISNKLHKKELAKRVSQ
jgi:uncharacterized membrane protein YgaE (UPF0421/DUF939 family)